MGGGKGGAPSAPNYKKLAKQDAEAQKQAALAQTTANRPNQYGPGGNIEWTQDPTDPNKWTQRTNLDPAAQGQYDRANQIATGAMGDLAKQGAWNAPDPNKIYEGAPLDDFKSQDLQYDDSGNPVYDPNAGKMMADALYAKTMNRARPDQERKMGMFRSQLSQQGLQPGSAAYDRAMQNLMTSQGDVATQAGLEAQLAGGQEARNEYQNALSGRANNRAEFGAKLSGQQNTRDDYQAMLAQQENARQNSALTAQQQNQNFLQAKDNFMMPWDRAAAAQGLVGGVSMPQLSGFNGATGYNPANMTNAANMGYQARMGANNAQQAKQGSMINTGIMAGAMVMA